jgi:hypothetical protein
LNERPPSARLDPSDPASWKHGRNLLPSINANFSDGSLTSPQWEIRKAQGEQRGGAISHLPGTRNARKFAEVHVWVKIAFFLHLHDCLQASLVSGAEYWRDRAMCKSLAIRSLGGLLPDRRLISPIGHVVPGAMDNFGTCLHVAAEP